MRQTPADILARAAEYPVATREHAHRLAAALCPAPGVSDAALAEAARSRRDKVWGRQITFSPKVFLPLTNLCRNACDYCSFRRSPGDEGAWTMSPDEVRGALDLAAEQGCVEALFCLGDTPEAVFPTYRQELEAIGQESTVGYLEWAALEALKRGLLPHTNAGVLTRTELTRLRRVNVSMGLMLESISERLCAKGGAHHRAPDKQPARRLAMHWEAGALKIPFTTGLLIGIGETMAERVDTLWAIRALDEQLGHIGEVIVQNFRAHHSTPMAGAPEPTEAEVARMVSLARLILPDRISVQAPPNLNPGETERLVRAGLNDLGGISPVTPDYINPGHPWPQLAQLADECARAGKVLRPRLPIYRRHLSEPTFVDPALRAPCKEAARRLKHGVAPVQPAQVVAEARP